MGLIETLQEDHHRLLIQVGELEGILTGLTDPSSASGLDGVRQSLQRIIGLLEPHGELEREKLLPILQEALPAADQWLIGMTEVQDEMVLREARSLKELSSSVPLSIPVEEFRERGKSLIRWLQGHVAIEEERLFPKLEKP